MARPPWGAFVRIYLEHQRAALHGLGFDKVEPLLGGLLDVNRIGCIVLDGEFRRSALGRNLRFIPIDDDLWRFRDRYGAGGRLAAVSSRDGNSRGTGLHGRHLAAVIDSGDARYRGLPADFLVVGIVR